MKMKMNTQSSLIKSTPTLTPVVLHVYLPVVLPIEILNLIMSYMKGHTNDIMKEYFRQISKYTHDYDDKPMRIIRKNRIEYKNKHFKFYRYNGTFFRCINCNSSLDSRPGMYYRIGIKLCDMVCFDSYYNYY